MFNVAVTKGSQDIEMENVDSVEVRIGQRIYTLTATELTHLLVRTNSDKAMRLHGFSPAIEGRATARRATEEDRITLANEIIVGTHCEIS